AGRHHSHVATADPAPSHRRRRQVGRDGESPRRARGDPPRGPTRSQRAPRLRAYARFQLIDRPAIARVHDDAPRGAWTVAVLVTAGSPDDRRLVRAGLADRQPTRLAG